MGLFLTEGGVAGHMNHLYDNPNLTFKEMKKIFQAASAGELEGTEKTDGQNLQLSYDINTGTARAARNKGNIKDGGMDAAGLAAKFGGRGALETAFTEAFAAFEETVGYLSIEEREEIFGPNTNVYYNAEVQDPRAANLINYDLPTLTIHRVGHNEYDRETGQATGRDVSKNARKLAAALDRVQGERQEGKFFVQMNAIRRLEALADDTAANLASARLDSVLSDAGVSENQTVAEYMISRVDTMIDGRITLHGDLKMSLIKYIFKERDEEGKLLADKRSVLKLIPKEDEGTLSAVRNIMDDAQKIKFRAIMPVEEIVHDFSVEMLRGLHSAFILDNDAEVERLRQETARAITAIENSESEEAMEILAKQMSKLKDVEGVSTAAEGFVFDYDGVTYKFTGNFAPMNQLLGLFKYGRGDVPPMQKLDEEEVGEVKRKIAVFPGAFKPPHRGHMNVVEALLEQGADLVYILISKLDRKTPAGKPVNRDVSEKIWQIYIDSKGLGDRVFIGDSPYNAPVKAAYEVLRGTVPDLIPQAGDLIIPAASDKPDKRENPDYTRFLKFHEGIEGMIDGVIPANIMDWYYKAPSEAPMSASAFREALDTGIGLETFLPTGVHPAEVLSVLGVLPGEMDDFDTVSEPAAVGMMEMLERLIEETMDEMSSMSGGSVEGYSGGQKDDEEPSLIREEEPDEEDEVVEEVLNYLLGKGVLL
jgi:hypothetical protein